MKTTGSLLIALLALGALLTTRPAAAQTYACVEGNVGEFCMELLADRTPDTVANFLNYVEDGDYSDTFIHRSEPNFIIQGGGYTTDPLGEHVPEDDPVPNESGPPNTRGTVAMAKLPDDPDSATSEWFVNVADNNNLDLQNGGYTVFAEVACGMNIAEEISEAGRADLSSSLGAPFAAVPVLRKPDEGIGVDDLIQVNRVYTTDSLPAECGELLIDPLDTTPDTGDGGQDFDAVAHYFNGSFTIPVRVGQRLYRMTFNQQSGAPDYVFTVDTSRIFNLMDTDEETAVYHAGDRLLTIPTLSAGGNLYTDVTFRLTDKQTLEFTLEDFNRQE